jgi:hypothetical protein
MRFDFRFTPLASKKYKSGGMEYGVFFLVDIIVFIPKRESLFVKPI